MISGWIESQARRIDGSGVNFRLHSIRVNGMIKMGNRKLYEVLASTEATAPAETIRIEKGRVLIPVRISVALKGLDTSNLASPDRVRWWLDVIPGGGESAAPAMRFEIPVHGRIPPVAE